MGKRSAARIKGRASRGPFIALPRDVLNSPAWSALTAYEAKLLVDIAAAFRGNNNGDLTATWSLMHKRGWSSRETLANALNGLLDKGFLAKTRQGGRRTCSLFALTWEPIHECGGKLDIQPCAVPSNAWRSWPPRKIVDTPGGSHKHATRVNGTQKAQPLARLACQ